LSTLASVVIRDITANRPAAAIAGRIFYATDTGKIWRDNGTSWDDVTPTGGTVSPLTTKGDVYTFDTGNARLPVGTNGQVLTADSTQTQGIKWAAAATGALILLEEHTASASATLDFTAWYSASYDTYVIEFVNLVQATSGSSPTLRFSTNAGSTYDSGTNYKWQEEVMYTGSTANIYPAGSDADTSIHFGTGPSSTGNMGTSGTLKLFDPGSASKYKILTSMFCGEDNNHTANFETGTGGGVYWSLTAVNAFRILFSAGNITSGAVRVYGIAK